MTCLVWGGGGENVGPGPQWVRVPSLQITPPGACHCGLHCSQSGVPVFCSLPAPCDTSMVGSGTRTLSPFSTVPGQLLPVVPFGRGLGGIWEPFDPVLHFFFFGPDQR